nr:MAG TPA: hypothetical protein [Caudoviricetes sp.]
MSTSTKIGRSDPRFSFLPAAWAKGPVRFDGEIDIEDVALTVSRAVYLTSLRRTQLHQTLNDLSSVHVAAVTVACFADQVLPGSRPAGAGDLLAAAADRADRVAVSGPRIRLWWSDGLVDAVESILKLRDQEAAILLLTDIMLLVPEVLS